MLEKLALEYSPVGTFVLILAFAIIMVGVVPISFGEILETWQESEDEYKRFKIIDKILIGLSILIGVAICELLLFFAIKIQFIKISTYYGIHNNSSNVTEYYKIEQKDDLLDLKLKDKYRDLGVLQEREIVKLVKEDSNLYLIEYEGQYFEIEKEKK
jgi:hypothetical protein